MWLKGLTAAGRGGDERVRGSRGREAMTVYSRMMQRRGNNDKSKGGLNKDVQVQVASLNEVMYVDVNKWI